MNAFEEGKKIEKKALLEITPFLEKNSKEKRFVFTNKGNQSKFLQENIGDIAFNCTNENIWTAELKAEMNFTGNFFCETWSNKKRFTPGWMLKLKFVDFLFYYFVLRKLLYIIEFPKLINWAFTEVIKDNDNKIINYIGPIKDFKEVPQKKYTQLNDTWGHIIPINFIENKIGLKQFNLNNENINNKKQYGYKALWFDDKGRGCLFPRKSSQ